MEQRAPPTEPAYVKSSFTALGEGAMAAPIDLFAPIVGPPPGLPPVCPQPAAHKAETNSTASSEHKEVGEAAEELASAALEDMAMGMPGWNAWVPYAHDVQQMGLYSVCGPGHCWPYPPYWWPAMSMGAGVHPPGCDGWTAMETVQDDPIIGGLPPPPTLPLALAIPPQEDDWPEPLPGVPAAAVVDSRPTPPESPPGIPMVPSTLPPPDPCPAPGLTAPAADADTGMIFDKEGGTVHCDVCRIRLKSPLQWEEHRFGKKHLKKMDLKMRAQAEAFSGVMGAAVAFAAGKARREHDEPKESNLSDSLYIKGLPPRVTEGQLRVTFAKAGNVEELKILRHGSLLECAALVRMDSVASAQAAIDNLSGTTPQGAMIPLTVRYHGKKPNKPSDNLYVKRVPLYWTQDHLHLLFSQCGTVRRTKVLPFSNMAATDTAALVQMASLDGAQKAIQLLNGRVPDFFGPHMLIRFAKSKTPPKENKKEPNNNLYVKGLPLGTPDNLLRAVFCRYGKVLRSKVLEPRGSEASDCAAMVQMESVKQAAAAVEALHGQVLAAPLPPMRVCFAGKEQVNFGGWGG